MASDPSERTRAAREAAAARLREQGPSEAQLRQREEFIAARRARAAEQRAAREAAKRAPAIAEPDPTVEVQTVSDELVKPATYPERPPRPVAQPDEQPVEQAVPQPVDDELTSDPKPLQTTKNDGPSSDELPAWKRALGLTPPRRKR